MRLPKAGQLAGTNPALAQAIFNRKMAEAQNLEKTLEDQHFECETPKIHLVMSGKPQLLEITLKQDCSASDVLDAINDTLSKVHIYRDAMAQELIRGTP